MHRPAIRHYAPQDAGQITRMQQRYAMSWPGAVVVDPGVYGSPAFADGRNILCAVDASGTILGYAPIYPAAVSDADTDHPHTLWTALKVDPDLARPAPVQDALLEQMLARAGEIRQTLPARRTVLCAECVSTEELAIGYLQSHGFEHTNNVFTLERDLEAPIEPVPVPPGIVVRAWRMESEAEQQAYIQARDGCFPEGPWGLAYLQYFMQSPHWSVGATMAAFDGDQLVGNVMVYWDPHKGAPGYTEEIFVLPAWRRRGVASCMISRALRHLQQRGLHRARLQVSARNKRALSLYQRLGYKEVGRTLHLSRELVP